MLRRFLNLLMVSFSFCCLGNLCGCATTNPSGPAKADDISHFLADVQMQVNTEAYSAAINRIATAPKHISRDPDVQHLNAVAYLKLEQTQIAKQILAQNVSAYPEHGDSLLTMGEILAAEKSPEAVRYFEKAFNVRKSLPVPVARRLGSHLLKAGNSEKGAQVFEAIPVHQRCSHDWFNILVQGKSRLLTSDVRSLTNRYRNDEELLSLVVRSWDTTGVQFGDVLTICNQLKTLRSLSAYHCFYPLIAAEKNKLSTQMQLIHYLKEIEELRFRNQVSRRVQHFKKVAKNNQYDLHRHDRDIWWSVFTVEWGWTRASGMITAVAYDIAITHCFHGEFLSAKNALDDIAKTRVLPLRSQHIRACLHKEFHLSASKAIWIRLLKDLATSRRNTAKIREKTPLIFLKEVATQEDIFNRIESLAREHKDEYARRRRHPSIRRFLSTIIPVLGNFKRVLENVAQASEETKPKREVLYGKEILTSYAVGPQWYEATAMLERLKKKLSRLKYADEAQEQSRELLSDSAQLMWDGINTHVQGYYVKKEDYRGEFERGTGQYTTGRELFWKAFSRVWGVMNDHVPWVKPSEALQVLRIYPDLLNQSGNFVLAAVVASREAKKSKK